MTDSRPARSPATAPAPPPPRPRRSLRWLRPLVLALLTAVALLALVGASYQALGARADASSFPAPGRLVSVGDGVLHLYCTGTGSPTVVLESLSGGTSVNWGWVQPALAAETRVCSYDRAGRGWSRPSGADARDLWSTATDLTALLAAASVDGPYVLVGHSIGGHYVRAFAAAHPEQVAGVVLLDASHPELFERFPEYAAAAESYLLVARFFPVLARFGLFRLFFASGGEIDFAGLAEQQHDALAAFWSAPAYHRSQVSETRLAPTITEQARTLGDLGDTPLLVITAGASEPSWLSVQDDLASLSTNATHVTIPGATHVSLTFDEEDATTVARHVLGLVAAVRE